MAKKITAWKSTNGVIYETQKEAESIERDNKIEKELEKLVREYVHDITSGPSACADEGLEQYVDDIVCFIIDRIREINKILENGK